MEEDHLVDRDLGDRGEPTRRIQDRLLAPNVPDERRELAGDLVSSLAPSRLQDDAQDVEEAGDQREAPRTEHPAASGEPHGNPRDRPAPSRAAAPLFRPGSPLARHTPEMQDAPQLCSENGPPTAQDIARLTRQLYGLEATVEALPGFEDLNYRLRVGGAERVLKVASRGAPAADLELQDEVMRWLQPELKGQIQELLPTTSGARIAEVQGPGGPRLVRMLTYLPGQRMADVEGRSEALLRDLGAFLGRMDRSLLGFDHPRASRSLEWSLAETAALRRWISAVDDPPTRALVEAVLDRFDGAVAPVLPGLRSCVIHNDANDYNVLVEAGPRPTRLTGLIDFGDTVRAPMICELAIAIAYAVFDRDDPLEIAAILTESFHRELPLEADELEVLFDLVRSRMAMSVVLCSRELKLRPENTYLGVSVAPALRALAQLDQLREGHVRSRLRRACGLA